MAREHVATVVSGVSHPDDAFHGLSSKLFTVG